MNHIILITIQFLFLIGECFLETEIKYFVKKNDI